MAASWSEGNEVTPDHAKPLLPISRATVFFDGIFSTPRLQHPEGVAVASDGAVWCSSENGQILRIAPGGSGITEIATTGGFTLGLAFDGDRALYACDLRHAAVFRLDLPTRALTRLAAPGIRIPNFPVVDHRRSRLLVSDSHAFDTPGPGIWAFDLAGGPGRLWYDAPLVFANGMALTADGAALLVAETFARRIVCVAIEPDGKPGQVTPFAVDLPGLPDGLAIDAMGQVYVGCYEPSRILRLAPEGGAAAIYVSDETAHMLAHPTNLAFRGSDLFTANLGRWHVTRIASDTTAVPLGYSPP